MSEISVAEVLIALLILDDTARGFDLTFRDARGTNPQPSELLTKYEEKQFDGLILFAPSAKSKGKMRVREHNKLTNPVNI